MLILDRSGSMSGNPWRQVQEAACKMLDMTAVNRRIHCRIMIYNDGVEIVRPKAADVRRARSGGSTNFAAVFQKVRDVLYGRIRAERKSSGDSRMMSGLKKMSGKYGAAAATPETEACEDVRRKLFIFFMTDGQDTCNSHDQLLYAREKLQDAIGKYGQEVIVHVLGFSQYHDADFLESLTLLGTCKAGQYEILLYQASSFIADGSYNYVRPSDGEQALEKTLTNLMEATTGLVGKSVYLQLQLDNGATFLGDWFGVGDKEIVLPVSVSCQLCLSYTVGNT